MPLSDRYKNIINQIVSDLKTIADLEDDSNGEPRVHKWLASRTPKDGRFEIEVKASTMTAEFFTANSSNNTFTILADLIYYSDSGNNESVETGFTKALDKAGEIYDKFHGTNINNLCRIARVELAPGDGEFSGRALLAIPVRIIIRCEKVIVQ